MQSSSQNIQSSRSSHLLWCYTLAQKTLRTFQNAADCVSAVDCMKSLYQNLEWKCIFGLSAGNGEGTEKLTLLQSIFVLFTCFVMWRRSKTQSFWYRKTIIIISLSSCVWWVWCTVRSGNFQLIQMWFGVEVLISFFFFNSAWRIAVCGCFNCTIKTLIHIKHTSTQRYRIFPIFQSRHLDLSWWW